MSVKVAAIALSGVMGMAFVQSVDAQDIDYPVDTITLVTHSSPGGGSDVYLREMANFLSPIIGAEVVVDNVRGGAGARAIAKVATSEADGSIFYGATPTYINTSLLSAPEYGHDSVEPVVNFFLDPQVIFVKADSPFQSVSQAVEAAKANPGQQKWGTGTPGSLERQALEQLLQLTGVDATIITYDGGGDMMINVLNGTLDLGVGEIQEFLGQLQAGELRIIGTFTDERLELYPDVPTVREQGIDMSTHKFRGLVGPKGLPEDVIAAWEAAVPKVLEDPKFKEWYSSASLIPAFMPHDEFVPFVAEFVEGQREFFTKYGITAEE